MILTCRARSRSVWRWDNMSSSNCCMKAESGLGCVILLLGNMRFLSLILVDCLMMFLMQDTIILRNNTRPVTAIKMILYINILDNPYKKEYKVDYVAWWWGPTVFSVGVLSLRNERYEPGYMSFVMLVSDNSDIFQPIILIYLCKH